MSAPTLTGAQRTFLRGKGQLLQPAIKIGHTGLSEALLGELDRQLIRSELVKVRFLDADREKQAALCQEMLSKVPSAFLGSVGRTSLFYRPAADPADRRLVLPE